MRSYRVKNIPDEEKIEDTIKETTETRFSVLKFVGIFKILHLLERRK
jgi:hypothetical protein